MPEIEIILTCNAILFLDGNPKLSINLICSVTSQALLYMALCPVRPESVTWN